MKKYFVILITILMFGIFAVAATVLVFYINHPIEKADYNLEFDELACYSPKAVKMYMMHEETKYIERSHTVSGYFNMYQHLYYEADGGSELTESGIIDITNRQEYHFLFNKLYKSRHMLEMPRRNVKLYSYMFSNPAFKSEKGYSIKERIGDWHVLLEHTSGRTIELEVKYDEMTNKCTLYFIIKYPPTKLLAG
jgi:hypothetical protein